MGQLVSRLSRSFATKTRPSTVHGRTNTTSFDYRDRPRTQRHHCAFPKKPEAALDYAKAAILLCDQVGIPLRNAEAQICRGMGAHGSQSAKSLELRAATSLAQLWQRQGK